jgi:hypothetical protein
MPVEIRPPEYHVLLVGIDAYDGGGSLNGCVNDIDAIQRVLISKLGVGVDRLTRLASPRSGTTHETAVPEALPTLANLRRALEDLGGERVAPGDRVFIYYSGHGTQCLVVAPDGSTCLREALLPKDHVQGQERRYLFDWELNGLLARIAARTPAVTVILDCCCSAGATRDGFDTEDAQARFLPAPEPVVLAPGHAPLTGASPRGLAGGLFGGVQVCQVVAACLDDERAMESGGHDGRPHGGLTRALVNQLEALSQDELAELRWGRIWRSVVAEVTALNPAQHPWISGGFARRVFGGPPERGDVGYAITRDGDTYRLDAGTLSGITERAEIGLYEATPAEFPPLDSEEDLAARRGLLRVMRASRSEAEAVAVTQPPPLPPGARGRLVRAGKAAKLLVALEPHDEGLAAGLARSPLLQVAGPGQAGEVSLLRRGDGGWAVCDDVFGTGDTPDEPTLVILPPNRLERAREVLEHYHRYAAPLRLARGCQDLPRALRLRLLDCNAMPRLTREQAQSPSLPEVPAGRRAPYEVRAQRGPKPGDRVCFAVDNCSDHGLRVTLLDCQASGRVAILGEKKIAAGGKHVFWLEEDLGTPFEAWLPDGKDLSVDRLVAIGTTRLDSSLRHLEVGASFEELLAPKREKDRDVEPPMDEPQPVEHWTSVGTAVRMTR